MNSQDMVSEMKATAAAEVQKYSDLSDAITADLKVATDAGYDQALKDQQVPADQKIYTQADMDAEVAPLQTQLAALQAKVDAIGDVDAKIAAAVSAKQADMLADFKNAELDNAAVIAKYEPPTA